jgi:Tfp pilus assembly protein PilO
MQKREKILAIGVGVLVLGYVGNWMFSSLLQGPLNERYARIDKLKSDIARKQVQIHRGRQAARKLDEWQAQSLPSKREVAASLYQDWLLEQVAKAGFKMPNVDSGEAVNRKDLYIRLPFSVRGRATLEQLTQFLYQFYSANHLHQVQRINITPVPKSEELELSLGIEALVLPGADRTDRLSDEHSQRLASEDFTAYQPILERNLFGQSAAGVDPADFAFLTAVLDVGGTAQAWLTVRTTGEILKLKQGESFEVGQFRGTVTEIASPDIIIDSDEERWLLTLGEKLSQATALPPGF